MKTSSETSNSWIPELVSRLSKKASFRRNSNSKNDSKKKVRFCEDESTSYETSSHPEDLHAELWYTHSECKQLLRDDVDLLTFKQTPIYDPRARGLENYLTSPVEHNLRRHSLNQYRRAIAKQSKRSRKSSRILLISKKRKDEDLDGVSKFSLKATASFKDSAHQAARRDEEEARMIYLEDFPDLLAATSSDDDDYSSDFEY